MSHFAVRASRPSDHRGLAAILTDLLGLAKLSETLASALNTNLLRILSQPGGTLLVAEDEEGELLGLVSLWSRWGIFDDAPVAIIDTLVVRDTRREGSVPFALLEQALGAAQALGCTEIDFVPGEGSMVPEEALTAFGFEVRDGARYTLKQG